jgi:KRAB domain-containing zinc finger protein
MTDISNNISTNNFKIQEFQCDSCDKAFGQNAHLQTHINAIHKNIKRFACDLCDYSSYHRTDVENHSKAVHHGETKDFKCDNCDKAFTRKTVLVRVRVIIVGKKVNHRIGTH